MCTILLPLCSTGEKEKADGKAIIWWTDHHVNSCDDHSTSTHAQTVCLVCITQCVCNVCNVYNVQWALDDVTPTRLDDVFSLQSDDVMCTRLDDVSMQCEQCVHHHMMWPSTQSVLPTKHFIRLMMRSLNRVFIDQTEKKEVPWTNHFSRQNLHGICATSHRPLGGEPIS